MAKRALANDDDERPSPRRALIDELLALAAEIGARVDRRPSVGS
jgi:hypothetical protein